jgi:hypothetical protein
VGPSGTRRVSKWLEKGKLCGAVLSRPTTRPSKFFELKALRGSRAARYTFTDPTDEQRARELLAGMLVSLEETKAITATPDTNTGGLTFKTLAAQ